MENDQKTPYEIIGGEQTLKSLCQIFYQYMDRAPELAVLRALHPKNLGPAEEKLYLFLSGWLGGPNLYQEKYGHPRLRARHMPFPIGKEERDQWIICMVYAFDELKIEEPIRSELLYSIARLADHMRNIT